MAETNMQHDDMFERANAQAEGESSERRAILVASALIVLAGEDFSSPVVEDLSDIPMGAHVVVTASRDNDFYTLPGGKKDEMDFDILAACVREAREELGIVIDPGDLVETDRSIVPAQTDPTQQVDITTLHARSFSGGLQPHAEIRDVALVPVHGESPVPLSDVLARIVLPSLRVA